MNLFCFASRNLENIRRGIVARRWAVSTASDSTNRGRRTKAARYFSPGDRGLLYCEQTHSFTTPFIVLLRLPLSSNPRRILTSWLSMFGRNPGFSLSRSLLWAISKSNSLGMLLGCAGRS